MSDLRTYDPKKVIVNVSGVPMSGFADGTFVMCERTSDSWSDVAGTDGAISRAKSNDKRGTIMLTFQQTSPSNDVLSGIAALDAEKNAGIVPILISDLSGRTLVESSFSYVRRPPNVEFGKEITNREWTFACADLKMYHGGNPGVGSPLGAVGALF